jgi:hypothetical protein
MAGFGRFGLAAGLLLLSTGAAPAFNGTHGFFGPAVRPAYSVYASPVYYAYPYCYAYPGVAVTYAYPTVIPVGPPAVPLAVPTPAPPSQTKEPPTAAPVKPAPNPKVQSKTATPGGPHVSESRSTVAAKMKAATAGRHRVGFWNLTGKDVTLTVDGQTQRLPRDRAVTLELGPQFVWQIDQQPPRTERVPDNLPGHEVVIRP